MNSRLFSTLIVFTAILALYNNSVKLFDTILLILSSIFMLIIARRYSFNENVGKYVVLLTFWISVIFMPGLHLVYPLIQSQIQSITQIDYNHLLSFGSKVFFMTTFFWLIFTPFFKTNKISRRIFTPKLIDGKYIHIGFVFFTLITLFCIRTGLGRMGSEDVVLPFHLGGIINLTRSALVPSLVTIIVENYYLSNKKIPKELFVYYFVWTILEMFAWMSKSVLLRNFLPLFVIMLLYYKWTFKQILVKVFPFLCVFLFLYPIIEVMRNSTDGSLIENYQNARNTVEVNSEVSETLLKPLNRTFITGYQYAEDYYLLDESNLFDFSRLGSIVLLGGSAGFQTSYIDGYSGLTRHSSGTSGLMDPLLIGGYGLCYVMIIILVSLGVLLDNYKRRWQHLSIYVFLIIMLWNSSAFINLSNFYNADGLQSIFINIVSLYIAYRINFKRSILTNS